MEQGGEVPFALARDREAGPVASPVRRAPKARSGRSWWAGLSNQQQMLVLGLGIVVLAIAVMAFPTGGASPEPAKTGSPAPAAPPATSSPAPPQSQGSGQLPLTTLPPATVPADMPIDLTPPARDPVAPLSRLR
jgi:hypothetical protein